jgi:hypothetical protein
LIGNHWLSLSQNKDWPTNLKRLSILLITAACVLCWPKMVPASEGISVSGYCKSYFTALDQPDLGNLPESADQPIIGAVNNRLRIKVFDRLNEWMSLTFAYDFSPRVQDESLFEQQALDVGFDPQIYRAADLDARLYPEEGKSVSSFAIFQNLDRAYLTINSKLADVYLGRQAIAWGSARVINPTDVIVPYAFNELDVEDRVGVDGIRVRMPIGLMEELDAGWVFGEDFDLPNSAIFLRSRLYFERTDLSLLAIDFRENLLLGLDLTRSVGGAGFWFEGAYVFIDAFNSDRAGNDEDYFRSSVGVDYSLRGGIYLFAEYHYNQAGVSDPERYLGNSQETAYGEGSVYLLGTHYLAPGVNFQITPLTAFAGQALVNLADHSIFLVPQVESNIAENVYLSGGVYLGFGKKPWWDNRDYSYGPFLHLRSEFGAHPDVYFASFRFYF